MSERSAEAIINKMLFILKKIESTAVKLNWQASRADTEQEPLKEQLTRWAEYRNRNYVQAENYLLMRLKGEDKAVKMDNVSEDEFAGITRIVLYFFAVNDDIDPIKAGGIGDKERAALAAMLDKSLKVQSEIDGMILETAVETALEIEGKSPVSHLFSVIPKKHVIPNNRLSNELTGTIIGAGAIDLVVGNRGKKNEMTALCVLSYEGDNVKITGRQPFTEYDRNVMNAAVSLYVYGNTDKIFTPAMVYRAMVNMTDAESPSKEQIEAVTNSLDKMRFIRVRVDCTDELKRRGASIDGEQISSGKIDTYLLMMEGVEVIAGGKTMSAYQVMRAPILYEYSSLIGQVLTVPASLMDIYENGQRVRNTEQRIAIKGYLLRRIEVMKGKTSARQSNRILFDAVYEAASVQNPSRTEMQRLRAYAYTVLNYWQEQGYIKGYDEVRNGTALTGIDILL